MLRGAVVAVPVLLFRFCLWDSLLVAAESADAREMEMDLGLGPSRVGVEDLEVVIVDSEESVALAPSSETRCLPYPIE